MRKNDNNSVNQRPKRFGLWVVVGIAILILIPVMITLINNHRTEIDKERHIWIEKTTFRAVDSLTGNSYYFSYRSHSEIHFKVDSPDGHILFNTYLVLDNAKLYYGVDGEYLGYLIVAENGDLELHSENKEYNNLVFRCIIDRHDPARPKNRAERQEDNTLKLSSNPAHYLDDK
mgnify:CR=1 FL=1